MHIIRFHIRCMFFMAAVLQSYSRHISFDAENKSHILSQDEKCDGICVTLGCVKAAARIASSLDESVDPCENFYKFACGGLSDNTDIFNEMNQGVKRNLKALIERELDGTEPPFVKMLKDFYDACTDLETRDNLGSEQLKKDLASLGGWPVVEGDQWKEANFDWVDTSISFRRLGYNSDILFFLDIGDDELNKTIYTLYMRPPSLGFDRRVLIRGLSDSNTAAHYKMAVKEAVLLGADENSAEKELLEALKFEIDLAKISTPGIENQDDNDINTEFTPTKEEEGEENLKFSRKRRERRDASRMFPKYTIAELQDMVPEIPWLKYFNGLVNDEIGETESIAVIFPVFLKKLAKLLEKTEKRVVANYMFWRVVDEMKSDLSKEWRELDEYYDKRPDEICVDKVSDSLPIAMYSYYVRVYLKEDNRNSVKELVTYIHRELLRIIEDSDWMDDMTKKLAIEKANNMKTIIGGPEELLNDTAVMEIYESLTISNSSYYENLLNIRKWQKDDEFSSLRKPRSNSTWKKHAGTTGVNAFYNADENLMRIPAGILQGVFFDKARPRYMNFGGIGYVIGHEITHGFDTEGKEFDKDGNEVDWWDKTTEELYHKRVQCMIEQYNNYTSESGRKVDGERSQAENIADNGGLKEAYRAYRRWVEDNGEEPVLPGLKFTQNQLFWISAANVWCSKSILEDLDDPMPESGEHSPAEFRVIGPMSNLPEFSEDFCCPPDSPMNRRNKCHVW